ncbi:MAG: putative metal-dependent hydrolase, TIM-barrel fold [Variovorax sp.]|nr:putative metal-dependent hydrolase, TIM-barrel fold [Variovorax sp.]
MNTPRPRTPLPPGACDCHTHVFPEARNFPFHPTRRYTPPTASIESLTTLHDGLGIPRVVIVQPSVYGPDNAATLHALRLLGKRRARGVAVIDDDISDAVLNELAAAGVCGVRVNLEIDNAGDASEASAQMVRTAARVALLGWHVQVYASMQLLAACSDVVRALPVPVVFDHYAGAQAGFGADQRGLEEVLELVRDGRAYVKLSAPYRCSKQADYADLEPLAQRFIACNPERMLWGSDWPHPQPGVRPHATDIFPPHDVDNAQVLDQLRRWTADESTFRKMLVENPARLYGFGD